MNRSMQTALVLAVLVLFILSPFAGLALLMGVMVIAAILWMISSLVQGIASGQEEFDNAEK